ncbi:MAG TPA: hypothetical protein VM537_18360 [Anaerolineae bacterium]|nr:hypothetical protein [Anaerolineae bacterium]
MGKSAQPSQGVVRLAEIDAEIQAALQLLTSESAEEIIGDTPREEFGVLIKGGRAMVALLWAGMQTCGVRKNKTSLDYVSKAVIVIAQMINYAYALGIRRGREG